MEPGSAVDAEAGLEAAAPPEWLVVTCDGRAFAFEVARVRSILPTPPFTRLPGCGPHVCGLASLRGRIVTALDLGVVLGVRAAAQAADGRLVLVTHGERTIGFVVDEVRMTAALWLEPHPSNGGEGLDTLGTGDVEGTPVSGIDVDAIIDRLMT